MITHTVSFGKDSHNGKTGSYIFRLAEMAPDGALEENFTMNYSLRVIQAQCAYFDIKNNTWYTDGVKVGSQVGVMVTDVLYTKALSYKAIPKRKAIHILMLICYS